MKTKWIYLSAAFFGLLIMQACEGQKDSEQSGGDTNDVYYENIAATAEDIDGQIMEPDAYDDGTDIEFNTEEYAYLPENDFLSPSTNPLSTFSIDVDNASYTNCRRMITEGSKPPIDAVRSEEFINYFDYNYAIPTKDEVFSVQTEMGDCPWNEKAKLLHIALQGYTVATEKLPPANLVFLIDVSGSMEDENKLPLLKKSFKLLVDKLNADDKVAIVTYAGDERLVLESTSCKNREEIKDAIDNLASGGSTNGAGGINMAYEQAQKGFLKNGNNRVILATDGDFNVGPSSDGELTRIIEEKRDQGVYLTILGFGMGNYKDSKMESLADHGNGNYFYIDDIRESNRVLVSNLAGTLLAIAKDVKIQVEFNPELVSEYRLVGYENRLMNAEDFEDDTKDAGELGAGHTVTAIYEIVPGKSEKSKLKYQAVSSSGSTELANIKLRYKKPDSDKSELIELAVTDKNLSWESNSDNYKFSVAVAGFSLILRESKHIEGFDYDDVLSICKVVKFADEMEKYEFMRLVEEAKLIVEA